LTQHIKFEKRLLLVGASVFVFCQNSNEKSESEVIFGHFNTEKSAKVG
jgi:hypothetical protein